MIAFHRLIELRVTRLRLAVGTIVFWSSGPVFAQSNATTGGADSPAEVDVTNDRARARVLFQQGQVHYSLAEYDEAIALFREAYELTGAPGLLFDTAQAHRLKGDCQRAVEIYRHFLRLAPASKQAGEAQVHVSALAPTCPGLEMAANDQRRATANSDAVSGKEGDIGGVHQTGQPPMLSARGDNPLQRWSTKTRLRVGLVVTGVATGAIAGVLYWWNDSRHDRWATEDTFLREHSPPDANQSIWIGRQDRNDDLLHSIWHLDTVVRVLAVGSGLSILSSAVLGILPEHVPVVSFSSSIFQMRWTVSWL